MTLGLLPGSHSPWTAESLSPSRMKDIFGLEEQPALVVGGGYGSGRLLSLLLARAGARLAVIDIDGDRARSVASEVGGHAITADIRDETTARRAVDEAHEVLGGLTRVANIVGPE
jgi:NAD(P)-dependent dehydrogenase (short-subunit alcohol dehydrogenase family)